MKGPRPDLLGEVAARAGFTPHPGLRQFVVQHLYEDTLRLLLTSHRYYPLETVIGIGYSGRTQVVEALRSRGIRVLTPTYGDLTGVVREELQQALLRCKERGGQLLIHEVGGTAITSLHRDFPDQVPLVRGAMEITKQGVWAAQRLPVLRIPQLNCAETRLKALEGPFVGDAVVHSIDHILRELGVAMAGRASLVMGYGWVGRGVCRALRRRGMLVAAHDTDAIQRVAMKLDGYALLEEIESLRRCALVVGAAGQRTIDKTLIDRLVTGTFLASASSKDVEIDVAYLRQVAQHVEPLHPHVDAYQIGERRLYLMNRGFPINFTGSSVQDEIVELLFAEALILLGKLAADPPPPPGCHPLSLAEEQLPASLWLELRREHHASDSLRFPNPWSL